MSLFLYNLSVRLYVFAIRIASFFNAKAKLWVEGRQNWQCQYAKDWKSINKDKATTAWVHCASLGEFEQGRPLIEQLRAQFPDVKILLTFFSPSGYEIRKNYPHADYICYLPADSGANALKFIEIFQPTLVVFVKYEFWVFFLQALDRQGIPILLVSAIFRENQIFFKPYGRLFRRLLPRFRHIFVQNQSSARLLEKSGLHNYSLSGDTRVDRVVQIAAEAPEFQLVKGFVEDKMILVAGSTWAPDEAILSPFINEHLPADWKVIIAPHQIGENHLVNIEKLLKRNVLRYSQATPEQTKEAQVLLIDNIGMLAALYRYGRIAYIGGGFGAGIHNTLEPITFGLPVIFGPKYHKFEEAVQLTQKGGAFTIHTTADFQKIFQQLLDTDAYKTASNLARQYAMNNRGATAKILQFIVENELLIRKNK